ncbi:NRDE family protein [Microbulbifer taiwanensis]|uniref:NRDE family protein n=1 Tax=Microbulbifer taiwanensis TaxID=986746 RepID=A0ABW1YLL5_9GAMM|nr:NRDE family protein [Microbulbifer taiwanensis]
MCLLLFAYRCHPQYPLLLMANRDEFYHRPTAPAAPWEDGQLVAGRDLLAGGTWAGIARGRAAAVTNMREPQVPAPSEPLSRGDIPRDFLLGGAEPGDFTMGLAAQRYRGFNALLFQLDAGSELVCAGNRHSPFSFTSGIHGISNGAPDAPWPKVEKGRAEVARIVAGIGAEIDEDNFVQPALALLQDRSEAAPADLPSTGVGPELELALSPIFVQIDRRDDIPAAAAGDSAGGYGTRASTLIAIDRRGRTQLWEQNYTAGRADGPLRHFALG